MNDVPERMLIQGPRYTQGLNNTSTELTRIIAADFGWETGLDDVCWAGQRRLAGSVEELAELVDAAGWLSRWGAQLTGVAWSVIPDTSDAAAEQLLIS